MLSRRAAMPSTNSGVKRSSVHPGKSPTRESLPWRAAWICASGDRAIC